MQQEASIRQQVQELSLDIKYLQREQQAMEVDMVVLQNAFKQVEVCATSVHAAWRITHTCPTQQETESKDMEEALEKFLQEADVQFEQARGIAEQRGELRQALLQLESFHMTISAEQQARSEAHEMAYQEMEVLQEYLVRLQQQTEVEEAVKEVSQAAIKTCGPLVLSLFQTSGAERTIFDEALHHIVLARKAERPHAVDLEEMDADAELSESLAAAAAAAQAAEVVETHAQHTLDSPSSDADSGDDVGFFLTAVEEPVAERSHTPAVTAAAATTASDSKTTAGPDEAHAATRIQAQWRGAQVRKGDTAPGMGAAATNSKASTGHGAYRTGSSSDMHPPRPRTRERTVDSISKALPSLHVPASMDLDNLDVVALLMSAALDGSGRKRMPRRLSVGAPSSRHRRGSAETQTTAPEAVSESNSSGALRKSVEHEGVTLTHADLQTARQYALTQIKLLNSQGVTVDTIGSYLGLVELRLVRLLDALAQAVGVQAPRQFKQLVNDALTAHDSDGAQPSLSRLLSAGVASPHFRGPDVSPSKTPAVAEETAEAAVLATNAAVLRVDKQRVDEAVSRAGALTLGGMRQGVGDDLQLWLASQKQQSYGGRQGKIRRRAEERAKSQPHSRTGSADARMRGQMAVAGGVPSKRTLGSATALGNSAVMPYFAGYEALESEPSTAQLLNAAGLGVGGDALVKPGVLQHSPLIDSHPLAGSDGRVINATDAALVRSFNVIPPEMPQLSGQKQRDAHYLLRLSQLAGLPLSPRTLKRTLEGATGGVVVGGLPGVRAAMKAMTADNFVAGRSSQAEDIGRNLAMAGIALEDDEEALPNLKKSGSHASHSETKRSGGVRTGMLQTFAAGDFSASSAAESGMDIGTSLRALLLSPARSTAGLEQDSATKKHPGRNRRGSAGSRASAATDEYRGVDLEASYFALPAGHNRPSTAQSESSVPDMPQTAEDILAEFQALRQLDGSSVSKGLARGAEVQRLSSTARSQLHSSSGMRHNSSGTAQHTNPNGVARDMAASRLRSPDRQSSTWRAQAASLPMAPPLKPGDEAMVDAAAMLPPARSPATHKAVKLTPLGIARARLQASTAAVPASLRQRAAQQAFLSPADASSEPASTAGTSNARNQSATGRRQSAMGGSTRPHSSEGRGGGNSTALGMSESAPALRGGGSSASKRPSDNFQHVKRSERAAWEEVKGLRDMADLNPNIAAAVGIPSKHSGAPSAWRSTQAARARSASPQPAGDAALLETQAVFQRVDLPERGLAHVPRELSGTARVRPLSAAHRLRSVIDPSGRRASQVHEKWAPEATEQHRLLKTESLQDEVAAAMRSVPLASGASAANMGALLSQVALEGFQKPPVARSRRTSSKSERGADTKASASIPRLASATSDSFAVDRSPGKPSLQQPGIDGSDALAATAPAATTALSPVTSAGRGGSQTLTRTLPRNAKVSEPSGRLRVTAPPRSAADRPWASPPKSWAHAHGREANHAGDVPIRIAGVPGLGSVVVGTGAATSTARSKSVSPNQTSDGADMASPAMPIGAARLSPLSNAQFPVGFDELMRDVEAQYAGEGGVKAFVVAGDLDPETLRKREAERKAATAEAARRAALEQTVSESTKRAVSRWKEVGITLGAKRKTTPGSAQGKTEKAFQGAAAAAATGWDGLIKSPGAPRQLAALTKQKQQRPATSHGPASKAGDSQPDMTDYAAPSPVRSSMSAHAKLRPHGAGLAGPADPPAPQQAQHLAGGTTKASRVKNPVRMRSQNEKWGTGDTNATGTKPAAASTSADTKSATLQGGEFGNTAPARSSSPVDKALQDQVQEVAKLPGSHTTVKRTRRSSIGSPYKGVVITKPPTRRAALGQVRKPRKGGSSTLTSPFDSALDAGLRQDEMADGDARSAGTSTGGGGGFTAESLSRHDLAAALGGDAAEGDAQHGQTSGARNVSQSSHPASHGDTSQRSRPSLVQSSPLIQSLGGTRVSSRSGGRGRKLSPISSTRPGSLSIKSGAVADDFEVSSTGAVGTNAGVLGGVRFTEATPTHSAMRAAARKQRTSPRDTLEASKEPSDDQTVNSTRVQGAAATVGRN